MKFMSLFTLLGALLFIPTTHAAEQAAFSGMSYLDNGTVRIGINLDIGGAITYLSKSKDGENIINSHDWGRQIQMSFYSGPTPYEPDGKKPAPAWTFIGWNPIQSGDVAGNPSKVIAHTNNGTEMYVKCIPMHWPLDNEPGHCTFESWLTLKDNTVSVRSQINNARDDHTQHNARGQELPAVYTNGNYYRLFTYDGGQPFSGAPLRQITKVWDTKYPPAEAPGGPWDSWYGTESWAALVRDDGFGLGIWTPGTYQFTGGFAGKPGKGGPKDGPTGYISPIRREILDHNIQYQYDYTLIVGQLETIRDYVYKHAERVTLPDYTFDNDRQSWTLAGASDAGWPMTGHWKVTLADKSARMAGPNTFWKASDLPTLYIRAAYDTGSTTATLRWEGFAGQGGGQTQFEVIPDGVMRTYTIDLAAAKGYTGNCAKFILIPGADGGANRTVTVESISHKKP